jgi:hypothetical protein
MEIEQIREGQRLKIKGVVYKVINIHEETKPNKVLGGKMHNIVVINLCVAGSSSALPTRELRFYKDSEEFYMYDGDESPINARDIEEA